LIFYFFSLSSYRLTVKKSHASTGPVSVVCASKELGVCSVDLGFNKPVSNKVPYSFLWERCLRNRPFETNHNIIKASAGSFLN
jgi:hypothetical protein